MRKLTHEEITVRQVKKCADSKLPVCVVLNNIRSLHNVGTIFRTADGAGVQKLWLCGITGYPPQGGIAKTALGAQDHVPWEYREDAAGLLKELKKEGYQIVLLEQMQGSVRHDRFRPEFPLCLVMGNEVSGISDGLQSWADAAIEIEMQGIKNSLNVAVAFGIAVYQLRSSYRTLADARSRSKG
ncbi:MAG: RNA methyltransferase [Candidatus Omnitrophica bacterium]|nr:RNA methyltransferase [Candidatus Omnitrophota bacterium]MDE2231071.1 RNA methyltransferase [Candidatus Omnitrophota bacterium]